MPVLKRRDLGRGDPKLSLLRLWGQSSCKFQLLNYMSSSVLELPSSTHLYVTKSSLKDALSLVSLAGDKNSLQYAVPPENSIKRKILNIYHDSKAAGHLGRDQTFENVA